MKWLLILVVYASEHPVSFERFESKAICEAAGKTAVELLERRTPYAGTRFSCIPLE
jgi:hypothetical protein